MRRKIVERIKSESKLTETHFDIKRTNMPETKQTIKEVLPKQGLLYQEDMPTVVLCKPKILPLKSVTLEKLERMQREAQETVKQQEQQQQQHGEKDFFSDYS
uniref:BBSome-interacting protein 1 n=2 Tax=Magallana gigas TaxID=29159 RepID=A0A8W8IIM9_MAGGI